MEQVTKERRERKDTLRNLERVLAAANELFAERGSLVTMEEVARRAGVGVGTVYRRFPSKEHLFAAVSHAACDHTRHCLQDATAAALDPSLKIRTLVETLYGRCQQQAALLDPATNGAAGTTVAEQHELYRAVFEMLRHTIWEGQHQGMFAPGDATVRAALCTDMLTPRVFHRMAQLTNGDASAVTDHITEFLLNGLRQR